MEPYSGLTDALTRIAAASSLPILWSTVKEFASRLGYSHVVAIDAARLGAGAGGAVMYADAPRQLFDAIDRELVCEKHPVVQRALNSHVPFAVSEMRNDPKHTGERWTELFAEVVKRGDGLIVPVYKGGDAEAGFSFGGDKPDMSAIARSMLQVVAHAAIDKSKELRSGNPPAAKTLLTLREAQCLRFVAIGKGDAEIGQTLGISPRTVRFHVDSAKVKLGVTSRIQAVAKALRERIIAV